MIDIAYVLAGAWLFGWAIVAWDGILRDRKQVTPYFIVVHFLLTGLPVVLDLLVGEPEYRPQPGFYSANQDQTTALVYCAYVSLCPVVWWAMRRPSGPRQPPRGRAAGLPEALALAPWRPLFWLMIVSPVAAVAMAPAPVLYLRYAVVPLNDVGAAVSDHHQFMTLATTLSTLGATLLLGSRSHLRPRHLVMLCPWLLLAFWLNGKRVIVFVTVVLIGLLVWHRHLIARRALVAASGIVIVILTVFTVAYQTGLRGVTVREAYDSARIDFARDNAIKMPIYAELHPERMRILERRGDSLLFNLTLFVPRAVWPDKPLPYAQYFTSAMLGTEARLWGWAMTTTWLGEALSNFGWFGLLLGPIALGMMARVADKQGTALVSALTVLVGALLMAVQLVAFLPLFVGWLLVVWKTGREVRRQRRPVTHAPAAAGPVGTS